MASKILRKHKQLLVYLAEGMQLKRVLQNTEKSTEVSANDLHTWKFAVAWTIKQNYPWI